MLLVNLLMVNNKCFILVDLLLCLHCMVITKLMSYQQINVHGCFAVMWCSSGTETSLSSQVFKGTEHTEWCKLWTDFRAGGLTCFHDFFFSLPSCPSTAYLFPPYPDASLHCESLIHYKTTGIGLVHHVVCLFTSKI